MDIPATLAAALPLSADARLILDILVERHTVSWASKSMLGRMRNLGLIEEIETGYRLTPMGFKIRRIGSEHRLETGRRQLGRGPIAGSGMTYGITARCSCGDWKGSRNESGAKVKRAIAKSHAAHMLTHLTNA